jgi:K319L-like, PKD domain
MERKSLALLSTVLTTLWLAACGGTASDNSATNVAPTANAGAGQVVNTDTVVTLDGSRSADPDGFIANYVWTQTGGSPTVTLSNRTDAKPTFTAPVVSTLTTLTFSLVVTDGVGVASTPTTVTVTISPTPVGNVTGRVRFMRIPETVNGLNYAAGQLQPARAILVLAVAPGSTDPDPQNAIASTTSLSDGTFTLDVPPNTSFDVLAVARMARGAPFALPHWDFRAQDNDAASPAPYTFTDGQTRNSDAATNIALDIPAGFDANGNVTGTRASAPFAVLDTVFQAAQLVLSAAPGTDFPPLVLDWAANNPGSQTFFDASGGQHITLSADATEDTDEFDQHVIAHEFGHYIEHNFSRADNIGGAHGLGDKLDIRVAFGEGFGYAFAAIALNDPVTYDSYVFNGQHASVFNVEQNPSTTVAGASPTGNFGCWCSESSVWSILWDLYDTVPDGADNVSLGFQPMWNVLTNEQKNTHAFTSIFSFIKALKANNPASAAAINTLIAAQNIDGANLDEFGTGETHVPTPVAAAAALPLYTPITVGGPAVVVRNVDDAGTFNTLGNHRFLRFTLNAPRTITISASSSNPNNADPDFDVFRDGGTFVISGADGPPQPETETISNAPAGDYLIDVYDCANGCSTDQGTPGDYDITVTVN